MRKITASLYALWVVLAISLKICGVINWWVATSPLWIPLCMALTFLMGVELSVAIGSIIRERDDKKIPDSCDVCLFGQTKEYSADNKCLGCVLNENHEYGKLCGSYKRNIVH